MYITQLSLTGITSPMDKHAHRAVALLFQQFDARISQQQEARPIRIYLPVKCSYLTIT
ncbi:hypothetical protein IEO21_09945 [Rhodonia placenta]|uniref:Uncharacterized protein n=1 Tax=Rhodonia placenta TaxID=104341 RepID=A0A8H7NTG6_9APHY|nr:hypothetical protein IEO21_09945 [Postia placenta]